MPPDVLAPDPDSLEDIVMVKVVVVGIEATINFTSVKSPDAKLELVIAVKLSNKIISPLFIPCADAKVNVTVADPLVVVKADVKVVVDLIGCMS